MDEWDALLSGVLLKTVDLDVCARALPAPQMRQLAYELAVGVIDADGVRNALESRFLDTLGRALELSARERTDPVATADALATVPLDEVPAEGEGLDDADLDRMIERYAITNGALELLPHALASLAIIPLQMKLVYRVGQRYGYSLDRAAIKDLLATLGVGLGGQYLEDVGRKIVGGLFGKVAGRLVGGVARGATGMAFSFATTYAIGHVAKCYYAGGRTLSRAALEATFRSILQDAKGLEARYRGEIERRAGSLEVGRVVEMVRES
jgi:uncharacterized protein (DUF697 family)